MRGRDVRGLPATFDTAGTLRLPIDLVLKIAQVTNGCVPLGLRLRQAARRLIAGSFGRKQLSPESSALCGGFFLGGCHLFQLLREIREIRVDATPSCRRGLLHRRQ